MQISREFIRHLLYADRYIVSALPPEQREQRQAVWMRDFLMSRYTLPAVKDGDVVFFRSLVRDDYKEMFHAVIDASGVKKPVVIEDYKDRPAPAELNRAASRYMLKAQDLWDFIDEPDGLMRSILFTRLNHYMFILNHFQTVRPAAVVFFADMQPTEHLLSWYLRKQGVKTITLQHGLYVDYTGYKTINCINYLHQPSEYFLSWGPETSRLISRHHPKNKIIECGKPLIFEAAPPAGHKDRPYIALLLDQMPFHEQNEEMIEMARTFALRKGLDVRVRFHPSLPKQEIMKKYPGMTEQRHFTDAYCVIGHTSSLLYEALALGCKVLRYATDIPAIRLPENSEFTTLREMEVRLSMTQPNDLWKQYFTAVGQNALANYSRFFEDLLSADIRQRSA